MRAYRIVVAQAQGGFVGLEGLVSLEDDLVGEGLEDGLAHWHDAGHLGGNGAGRG